MLKPLAALALLAAAPAGPEFIEGGVHGREPDGNTVIFEGKDGLIVVDTGRHKEHQAKILDAARKRGKPIAYVVNTHWHLDHSGGNQELRTAFPGAKIVTSNAVQGALTGFLAKSLDSSKAMLDDPKTSPEHRAAIGLFAEAMEHRQDLLPDIAVTGDTTLGTLRLHLAPFAATEGDTWLYDPESRTLVAGDLVLLPVPFFDTACAKGWSKALDRIAAQKFDRLIPGHGTILDRAQFLTWHSAFNRLLDCAEGTAAKTECAAGWERDAGPLLTTQQDRDYARGAIGYYIERILRVPAKQQELCGTAG